MPIPRDPAMAFPQAYSPGPHPVTAWAARPGVQPCGGWVGLSRHPHPESQEDELATHRPCHVQQEEGAVSSLGLVSPGPCYSLGGFCGGEAGRGPVLQGSARPLSQSRRVRPGTVSCIPPFHDSQPASMWMWPVLGHLELKKDPPREAPQAQGCVGEFGVSQGQWGQQRVQGASQ